MSELRKKSFQLPLDLSLPRVLNKGNFSKTSSNIRALKWVEECPDWPSHVINLYGPSGSGKTHLANIFCEKLGACYLEFKLIKELDPFSFSKLNKYIVIDDIREIRYENILFNLFNSMKDEGGKLLLLSRLPPVRWKIELPDLKSRLLSIPSIEILPPDEDSLKDILTNKCKNQGIELKASLIDYVIIRIPRTYYAINNFFEIINLLSLSKKKKPDLSLIRDIINNYKLDE